MAHQRAERGDFSVRTPTDTLRVSYVRRSGWVVSHLSVSRGERRVFHGRVDHNVASTLRSVSALQGEGNEILLDQCRHVLGVIGSMLGINTD